YRRSGRGAGAPPAARRPAPARGRRAAARARRAARRRGVPGAATPGARTSEGRQVPRRPRRAPLSVAAGMTYQPYLPATDMERFLRELAEFVTFDHAAPPLPRQHA